METFAYIFAGLLFAGAGVMMAVSKYTSNALPSESSRSVLGAIWPVFVCVGLGFLGFGVRNAMFSAEPISIEGATGELFSNAEDKVTPEGISIKDGIYCFRTPISHNIVCLEDEFKEADVNKDQIVSREEWEQYLRRVVDKNKDGQVANLKDRVRDN